MVLSPATYPNIRQPQANKLSEHLADFGSCREIACSAQWIAAVVIMGIRFGHIMGDGNGTARFNLTRKPLRQRQGNVSLHGRSHLEPRSVPRGLWLSGSGKGRPGSSAGSAIVPCAGRCVLRSAEQTSELQSLMRISYAVFCLKQKKKNTEYN